MKHAPARMMSAEFQLLTDLGNGAMSLHPILGIWERCTCGHNCTTEPNPMYVIATPRTIFLRHSWTRLSVCTCYVCTRWACNHATTRLAGPSGASRATRFTPYSPECSRNIYMPIYHASVTVHCGSDAMLGKGSASSAPTLLWTRSVSTRHRITPPYSMWGLIDGINACLLYTSPSPRD